MGVVIVKRLATWLSINADAGIALVVAIVIGLLVLADIMHGDQYVNAAVLIVLALLATTLLRDRVHVESESRRAEEVTSRTVELLARMPDAAEVDELRRTMESTRKAMDVATMVRVVPGDEVSQEHSIARRDTDRWHFKGGTGTYLRAVTLPQCVELARREKRTFSLRAEIIDPTDEVVCRRYAQYRHSLSPLPDGTGQTWTTDRTRKESYATVLAACWHRQRFAFLTVTLGLSPSMTTFRWDLSARCVIITQEDPALPALVAEAGRPYYRACDRELQASLEQARPVPLEAARQVELSDEPTIDQTRRLLRAVGLDVPRAYGDAEVGDIIRRAIQAPNPYE